MTVAEMKDIMGGAEVPEQTGWAKLLQWHRNNEPVRLMVTGGEGIVVTMTGRIVSFGPNADKTMVEASIADEASYQHDDGGNPVAGATLKLKNAKYVVAGGGRGLGFDESLGISLEWSGFPGGVVIFKLN